MNTFVGHTFGHFSLDPENRTLLENGRAVPIGSRAMDLLLALVEASDRVLTKDELIARVWPDSEVGENNLTVNISALRKVLGERANEQRFIRTIAGRGYRFVAATQRGTLRADVGVQPASPAEATRLELPSLAVLPFVNMSDNVDQEHFSDGITEDIISELSRNRWLRVIARNSSFTFKSTSTEIAEVARQFGVRYVLEGSVRRAGTRVRVTAQLIDAITGRHLLAERLDRDLIEVFAVQDEITARIVAAVRPTLYEAEQTRSLRKRPENIDAWAAYQRGVWHFSRYQEPESEKAQAWFEQAIMLDPQFAPGYYGLAVVHLHDGSAFRSRALRDWQERGEQLAARAVLLDEKDSGGHSMLALARMVRGDHTGALEAAFRAIELNPSDATAHGTAGATLVFIGRPREGLDSLAMSLRLSPRDPRLRIRQSHIGLGHLFLGQHDEAEAVARTIMRQYPEYSFGPRLLAIVCAETGRLEEARAAIDLAQSLMAAPFDDFSHARMPWYRPATTGGSSQHCGWLAGAGAQTRPGVQTEFRAIARRWHARWVVRLAVAVAGCLSNVFQPAVAAVGTPSVSAPVQPTLCSPAATAPQRRRTRERNHSCAG